MNKKKKSIIKIQGIIPVLVDGLSESFVLRLEGSLVVGFK